MQNYIDALMDKARIPYTAISIINNNLHVIIHGKAYVIEQITEAKAADFVYAIAADLRADSDDSGYYI